MKNKLRKLIIGSFLAVAFTLYCIVYCVQAYKYAHVPIARIVLRKDQPGHPPEYVTGFSFSPDDRYVAAAEVNPDNLTVWHVPDLSPISTHPLGYVADHNSIAWMSNEKIQVNTGTWFHFWAGEPSNAAHGQKEITEAAPWDFKEYRSVKVSPTGTMVAAGQDDGTLRLWYASTAKYRILSHPPPYKVSHAGYQLIGFNFSPDSSTLIAAYTYESDYKISLDQQTTSYPNDIEPVIIRLYDTKTGVLTRQWNWGAPWVGQIIPSNFGFAESPDSKQLAASCNGRLEIWDLQSGRSLQKIDAAVGPELAFIPGKPLIAIDRSGIDVPDNEIQIWKTNTGRPVQTFHESYYADQIFAVSNDGRYMITESVDKISNATLDLWDLSRL